MFNKILFISDNSFLLSKVDEILFEKRNNSFSFTYAISPFSNKKNFTKLNVVVYDLKSKEDIKEIIENYNLIISIHCKQLFPPSLVQNIKCINVHPGYNPINRGWYPQVFSIINDLPIGATIHEIDDKLDHGKIIARSFVPKYDYDTSETLYMRIIEKELTLFKLYIDKIINNNYETISPEDEGNLYLKKDFNNLLELDLDETTTVGNLINRLRALTHGAYNNAYFIDKKSGKKVFVGVKLKFDEDEKCRG